MRIGIAGLGTVGIGVLRILNARAPYFEKLLGDQTQITAVSARNSSKDRGVDLTNYRWFDHAVDMAKDPEIDIIIELIGGADGAAYELCQTALKQGKHVITANKALIAHHGIELAAIAEQQGVSLCFEAAVAGGIPIIKGLKEGLIANSFSRISAILNGTSNYILTQIEKTGKDFDEILKIAQEKGYAEADPSFDIDGIDTAHKLAIITSIAYGTKLDFEPIYVEGIRHIKATDITHAKRLGYSIKLLATCSKQEDGIVQRVHPALVPLDDPIAKVDDVFNAIVAQCDFAGKSVFEGRGAGEGPTASAVIADLCDIIQKRTSYPFKLPVSELASLPTLPIDAFSGGYYVRLEVKEKTGVLSEITQSLSQQNISIKTMAQEDATKDRATIIFTTYPVKETQMHLALDKLKLLDSVLGDPCVIRMEALE